uniref:Uncharacterized protein n=1 Tax=Oryza rufipogon TaxID=4529 RepID=A0A0E0MQ67_ORYRU
MRWRRRRREVVVKTSVEHLDPASLILATDGAGPFLIHLDLTAPRSAGGGHHLPVQRRPYLQKHHPAHWSYADRRALWEKQCPHYTELLSRPCCGQLSSRRVCPHHAWQRPTSLTRRQFQPLPPRHFAHTAFCVSVFFVYWDPRMGTMIQMAHLAWKMKLYINIINNKSMIYLLENNGEKQK